MKLLYRCDPDKNTECRKGNCFINKKAFACKLTSNPDYAVKDEKSGKPIVAYIHFDDAPPLCINGGADY